MNDYKPRQALSEWRYYALMSFIALCTFKVLMRCHDANLDRFARAAYSVIEGHPDWIAFQNRLLAPYLVLFISKLGLSYKTALLGYHAVALWLEVCLLFYVFRARGLEAARAAGWTIGALFVFLVMQDFWLYSWDGIDLIIFTLLAFGILQGWGPGAFVALFCVGILNRESALFIALFIALDSLTFDPARLRLRLTNWHRLLVGGMLLLAGAAYTKISRQLLFVSRPNGLADTEHQTMGNHFWLFDNLQYLFVRNFSNHHMVDSLAIFGGLAYFAWHARRYDDRQFKCFLMLLALLANIMIFGVIIETRLLFILIPFAALLHLDSRLGQGRPPRPD
ncbi:MAG: hypothetical protein DI603_08690 [Roseateles depolymerans]|uniref:Glycosyltransferase RgtA/B/C/D-like domain-containing protein n=1 Tax=Roseateles depolymerans TaxID=76731 RepID=A0A2W5DRL1_9BURK|nr:MAG: hypothetical protein DI603_08690 [Roseateles depolymerans]